MPVAELGALVALGRLRHAETDAARRKLGEALAHETTLAARQNTLVQELEAARRLSGEFDREAFAAWFGRARAEQERLGADIREAEAHTATLRTELANRRVAETAAETALAEARAARKAAAERGEQVMLEDVARALRRGDDH